MNNNNIILKPSDLGLKDLEVFYKPDCIFIESTESHKEAKSSSDFISQIKLTVTAGGIVAISFNNPTQAIESSKINILDSTPETSLVEKVVQSVENVTESIICEAEYIIKESSERQFTKDEIEEMEILDAYYKETRKYYPKKNKLSF